LILTVRLAIDAVLLLEIYDYIFIFEVHKINFFHAPDEEDK